MLITENLANLIICNEVVKANGDYCYSLSLTVNSFRDSHETLFKFVSTTTFATEFPAKK